MDGGGLMGVDYLNDGLQWLAILILLYMVVAGDHG